MANHKNIQGRIDGYNLVVEQGLSLTAAAQIMNVSVDTLSRYNLEHEELTSKSWLTLQKERRVTASVLLSKLRISLDNLVEFHNELSNSDQYKNATKFAQAVEKLAEQISLLEKSTTERTQHADAMISFTKYVLNNKEVAKEVRTMIATLTGAYLREATTEKGGSDNE